MPFHKNDTKIKERTRIIMVSNLLKSSIWSPLLISAILLVISHLSYANPLSKAIVTSSETVSDKENPSISVLEYNGKGSGKKPVLSSEDLGIYIEETIVKDGTGQLITHKLTVKEKEAVKFVWTTSESSVSFPLKVRILELDDSNKSREILVESFTGGANCCFQVFALTKIDNFWRRATLPLLHEVELTTSSEDGNVNALVTADGRFIGKFDCNSCSFAPSRIFRLEKGSFKDATKTAAYKHIHLKDLKKMNSWFDSPNSGVNGFLTGYVATMALLGRYEEAIIIMEKKFDPKNKVGLTICDKPMVLDQCEGKVLGQRTFPVALKELLSQVGYIK